MITVQIQISIIRHQYIILSMRKELFLTLSILLLSSLVLGGYTYTPSKNSNIHKPTYQPSGYKNKLYSGKYGYNSIIGKHSFGSFFDSYFENKEQSCVTRGYCGDAKPFGTQKDFVKFLDKFEQRQFDKFVPVALPSQNAPQPAPSVPAGDQGVNQNQGNQDFSETNNQVQNVDEADLIKTDGDYIYTISNGVISIIKAFPAEQAKLVSSIDIEGEYPQELFIEGDLMAIFGSKFEERSFVFVRVYDVSNRAKPKLIKTYEFEGYYIRGRKTDGVIYLVSNFGQFNRGKDLPFFTVNGEEMKVSPSKIFTYPQQYNYPTFTNIFALKLENSYEALDHPNVITLVIENSHQIYVSESNIYITNQDYSNPDLQKTIIHKVNFEGTDLVPYADGEVPGYIINQFSMDEFKDIFRIATTNGFGDQSSSGVYCLDEKLKVIGSVEKIAPTERIFSTRFIGDILYMVTFRQVDPFFTIDLSDHTNPRIIGQLKIPGFSRYLHPFDETTIIGLGNDATAQGQVLGLKVSLFDVSDLTNPKEIVSFVVSEQYSSSTALYESRAFLFSREKELMVIPGYYYNPESQTSFNGAFVFKVSKNEIALRGVIDHNKGEDQNRFYFNYVERSLYIGDNLYTKSNCLLKVNAIKDLSEVNQVQIPCRQQNFIIVDPVPLPQPRPLPVEEPIVLAQQPVDGQAATSPIAIQVKPVAPQPPKANEVQQRVYAKTNHLSWNSDHGYAV